MTNQTSISLLTRVRDPSDATAWQEFAALYETMVRRWLAGQGVQPQDADDVVQEVMTFVSGKIAEFDHSSRTGAFRNWLRQITSNRLREFWRKQQRHAPEGPDLGELADQLADDHSGVSGIWRREHDRFVLEKLLAKIAGQFQPASLIAFRKIVLEAKNAQEVANELGMSVGAVRVAQSRVLRTLRELGAGLID